MTTATSTHRSKCIEPLPHTTAHATAHSTPPRPAAYFPTRPSIPSSSQQHHAPPHTPPTRPLHATSPPHAVRLTAPHGPRVRAQVASDPSAAALHLTQAGVLRVDGVIDKALARALHAQCEQQLELALRHLRSGGARPTDWLAEHLLSLGPDLGKRHDCKLPLLPHVREALAQALRTLAAPIRLVVGSDAELFELSVVVSEPGCGRQPLHADFPQYADGEGAVAIVAFVATHDLRATMGPTIFLPRTHTAQFHAAFDATADDVDAREKLLAAQPAVSPVLRSGDVVLMDSALIHGGGANIVSRRALFHFSFKRPDAYPGGRFSSLLESLRGKHFLNEADDWLAEAPVDEATGMVL